MLVVERGRRERESLVPGLQQSVIGSCEGQKGGRADGGREEGKKGRQVENE